MPYRFRARISSQPGDGRADEPGRGGPSTLVEIWANGFAQQLVFVLEPTPGDVMLVTPDVLWLRPRHLHRLTRVPPDLRIFNGASISDVVSVDIVGNYAATLRAESDAGDDYLVELRADVVGLRYPRALYRIRRDDFRPLRIDFLAASGKALKSIRYGDFASVLDHVIPTRLLVEDHVYGDVTTIALSDFEPIADPDAARLSPDFLLALPDGAS